MLISLFIISDGSQSLYGYLRKETVDGIVYHKCVLCGKSTRDRGNMRKHVENIHFPNSFQYPCKYCEETFGTRNQLNIHISKLHTHSTL